MKQLIWILALVIIIFSGDRLIGSLLKKVVDESQFRYSRLYNSTEEADILLLGNSRGLTFFQPEIERITGHTTFNFSYNGLPMDLGKVLVQDYLDRHKQPKVLIIDVTMCDRPRPELVRHFKTYMPYSQRLETLIRQYNNNIGVGANLFHVYRYNSEVFQRSFYYRNRTDEDWLLDRVISQKMLEKKEFSDHKMLMDTTMIEQLKELVDYAKSKGMDVKLVVSPYLPQFADAIKPYYLEPLKSYIEAHVGLILQDYSTALTEGSEFGDFQHPNKKGSIKYIGMLYKDGNFNATAPAEATTIGFKSNNQLK
jgi:hypothetical protein